MTESKSYRLYVIASVIMAFTFILLVFMGISSWINFKVNRQNSIAFYQDKAELIITAIMHSIEDKKDEYAYHLIKSMYEDKNIKYGAVVAGDEVLFSKGISENSIKERDFFEKKDKGGVVSKILADSTMEAYADYDLCFDTTLKCRDYKLIIGFDLDRFNSARKADIRHTSVMFAIVLILGLGVSFFMYVISVYRKLIIMLKFTNEYTENVVKNMANGLITIDPDGFIVSYNLEGLNALGLNDKNVCRDINLNEFMDFHETGIKDTLESGRKIKDVECLYEQPGGKNVYLSMSATPIFHSVSNNYGAIIVIRDLTELKKLERRLMMVEKLAAVGKLAAVIAHEIRNPLSSIRGFGVLFTRHFSNDEKYRTYSEVIVKEVDRINGVVTDLLTYSKPVDLRISRVKIDELFDDILNIVDLELSGKNIQAEKIIMDDMLEMEIDLARMKQVLLNLVMNSLQAMGSGEKIEIGIKRSSEKDFADIWVEDSGPGIPEDMHETIFDLFYTTKEKGSGLGLAIVKKIVEYHFGTISIESPVKDNKGTRITIKLPYRDLKKNGR